MGLKRRGVVVQLDKEKYVFSHDDDDFATVRTLMAQLMSSLESLISLVSAQKPFFVGYDIERITKEDEKTCIAQGVKTLDVKILNHWTQLHKVLNAWKDFYAPQTGSTMFVHRLPGFVTIIENQDEVLELVNSINLIKDNIAKTVRKNRDKHQRHTFIHTAFPGIMTEQLYRKIQFKTDHVNNVWFNWARRPVPKSFTLEEAVAHVEKLKSIPPIDYNQTDWVVRLDKVINNINSGCFVSIQKLKEFRLLPTIEFNMIIDEQRTRSRHNATVPFILFGQMKKLNPTYSELLPFDKASRNNTSAFDATTKEMIDPYLSLVGVLA